jgi:hypothetical protein
MQPSIGWIVDLETPPGLWWGPRSCVGAFSLESVPPLLTPITRYVNALANSWRTPRPRALPRSRASGAVLVARHRLGGTRGVRRAASKTRSFTAEHMISSKVQHCLTDLPSQAERPVWLRTAQRCFHFESASCSQSLRRSESSPRSANLPLCANV